MAGSRELEFALRVQMNTLEPVRVFPAGAVAGGDVLQILGWLPAHSDCSGVWALVLYDGSMAPPSTAFPRLGLSAITQILLLLLAIIGLVLDWPSASRAA